MSSSSQNHQVAAYTKILRHRMAAQGHIDVNIILAGQAFAPSDLNEHLGRYVGWFETIAGEPAIMVLGRKVAGSDVSHVFLLRHNPGELVFPIEDKVWMSAKLRGSPYFVAVNLLADYAKFCTYAVLIEAMYFLLARDPFTTATILTIRMLDVESSTVPVIGDKLPVCRHSDQPEYRALVDIMKKNGLYLGDLNQPNLSRFFDVLRIPVDGHYVYGINYRQEEALLLVIPRIDSAPPKLHLQVIHHEVRERLPDLFKAFYTVRLRLEGDCNSSAVLKACILLTRIPLLYVDDSDVNSSLEVLEILSMGSSQKQPSQSLSSASQKSQTAIGCPDGDPKGTITATMSQSSRTPIMMSMDNQDLPLRTQQQVRREVGEYRAWMAAADDNTSTYPPSIRVKPRSMAKNNVVSDCEWMLRQMAVVTLTWERYATVKMLECQVLEGLGRRHIDDKSERFVILPIKRDSNDEVLGLMMFDKDRHEWGWIHPDNSAANSTELLTEVKKHLEISGPRYVDWKGQIIIITSSYHKEYPYIHLVMALYYIGRLFSYSVQLPAKIVYGERAFRMFAYHHCLSVQVINQEYNLRKGLIDGRGEPKDGAFISLPSPVQFERAVVPSDLCAFCKKRGFKNLGRHMSMSHGGQALMVNQLRQIQYGYTSND